MGLETLGDMPALLKACENALDVFPNKPEIYVYAATAELAMDNLSNAQDLINQVLPIAAKISGGSSTFVEPFGDGTNPTE